MCVLLSALHRFTGGRQFGKSPQLSANRNWGWEIAGGGKVASANLSAGMPVYDCTQVVI